MTAACPSFHNRILLVPVSAIQVDWQHRYRFSDWSEEKRNEIAQDLANPSSGGLINPIILSQEETGKEYVLHAGGHRLSAFLRNAEQQVPCPVDAYKSWTLIPARLGVGFSAADWAAREMAENFLRREIEWFPRARMIHDYHTAALRENPSWRLADTCLALSISDPHIISHSVQVIDLFLSQQEADAQSAAAVQDAPTFRSAIEITKRRNERKKAEEREQLLHAATVPAPRIPQATTTAVPPPVTVITTITPAPAESQPAEPSCPILLQSLESFTLSYSGPRFNLIHCDPPYGMDRDTFNGQSSRKDVERYDDDDTTLWAFLESLSLFLAKHAADSAHLILWFPVDLFKVRALQEMLQGFFPGWVLDRTPFIWTRAGSKGVAPSPGKTGRKNYEWAFLFSQGQRPSVKVVDMSLEADMERETRIHHSEKPFTVIRHLASMFVDSTTRCIDPTAGSGRPLQAIHSLGAQVLGLEKVPEIHAKALSDWARYLQDSSLSSTI